MLQPLVEEASTKARVVKVLADGGYDSKENFHYLDGKGIEPVIRVRRNSSRKSGGCMPRKLVAIRVPRRPRSMEAPARVRTALDG